MPRPANRVSVAREVILNNPALGAIQAQRQYTQVAGASVFNTPRYSAQWEEERAFRRSFWTPTLKLLGIRYRRPYNMRHTYATVMLMAGMTPAFCAKQPGHSVEMFLKTYSKWLDGDQDDLEMSRLESAIFPQDIPRKQNRRLSVCNVRGILGVADGARTHDNRNHNPGLYQLSYSHR